MKRYFVSLCDEHTHFEPVEGGYYVTSSWYTNVRFKRKSEMEAFLAEATNYYGGTSGNGWSILSGKGKPPIDSPYKGYC